MISSVNCSCADRAQLIPRRTRVLELRPNCECCDRDLPGDSLDAMICSFECTFCSACATRTLGFRCPNCGGELTRRPARTGKNLEKYPAARERRRTRAAATALSPH